MSSDHIDELGILALGSRLKRLSDRIMTDGARIYAAQEADFEPRWFPLATLLKKEPLLPVGDAAKALGLSHAAVSQLANAMTRSGIITSEKSAEDERRTLLSLTPKGQQLLEQVAPLWDNIRDALSEVAAASGTDFLAAVGHIEHALDVSSFYDRAMEHSRKRQRDAVEIVDYAPEHRASFEECNRYWLEKYFTVEPIDAEIFANPQGYILEKGGHIFMARLNGEIVGTCALIKTGENLFEVAKMGVLEKAQGKQAGKKLILACIEKARELGAESLELMTSNSLKSAVSLYQKVGFTITHCGPHPRYKRCDTVMAMDLRAPARERMRKSA